MFLYILSVCICVSLSVQAVTFECLDLVTSLLAWWYIMPLSRSGLNIKVIGQGQGHLMVKVVPKSKNSGPSTERHSCLESHHKIITLWSVCSEPLFNDVYFDCLLPEPYPREVTCITETLNSLLAVYKEGVLFAWNPWIQTVGTFYATFF